MIAGGESYEEPHNSADIIPIQAKRWLMAAVLGLLTAMVRFLMIVFGVVNDVYVFYFRISYIAVDWFTIVQFPGCMVADIIIAALIFNNDFGLRRLSITVATCCASTTLLLIMATQFPSAFPIIYIGELHMGLSYAILVSTFGQLTKFWFPAGQAGIAFSVFPIFTGVGSLLGFFISSNILVSPKTNETLDSSENISNWTNTNQTEWHSENKLAFLYLFSGLFATSLITLASVIVLFENKPPTNISLATENSNLLRNTDASECETKSSKFVMFLKECKRILFNKTLLLLSFIAVLRFAIVGINNIFLSEILRPIFSSMFSKTLTDPNVMSGHVLAVYVSTMIVVNILSGKFYDWYRKTFLQILFGLSALGLAAIVMAVAIHFNSIVGIWVSMLLFSVGIPVPVTPTFNSAMQCFQGTDPGFVLALFSFIMFGGTIALTQISRIALNFGGGIAVLIFEIIIVVFAVGVCVQLRPKLALN